ncbi:crossover junction endodeoxyribonuclease RuvC [Achromobacter sp. LC458]|uniref:hypothetical protein n=1 Tax=Achromobacter sp. LC458 TaxID=1120623 RepID=UPI0006998F11|nr:hypothetical protein [Achromobacter sp. LC458]TRM53292.1 crossover junction endodeoxyribonuclease RuvC [Achromobacter sp. LC458]
MNDTILSMPELEAYEPFAGTAHSPSIARAHVSDAADPWARGGHEMAPDASPRRADAGSTVASGAGVNVCILALDLGTKTGYALRRRDGSTRHGTEVFTPRKSWSEGQKWARYRAWLAGVINDEKVHRVVYEQVIRHEVKGRPVWDAAHAYGAFEAITHMVCDGFNIQAHGVNLSTVKKSFTGSGRAKKEDMMLQAKVRGFKVVDDNNADALAILHWAVAQERAA